MKNIKEIWKNGKPKEPNLWVSLSFEERRMWLDEVRLHCCNNIENDEYDKPANMVYELAGELIVDYPGFFCAIGEAINGPGGYFGACLDALNDCLCGDFGATVPFTLIWNNYKMSQKALSKHAWQKEINARHDGNELQNRFTVEKDLSSEILEIFEEKKVMVELR